MVRITEALILPFSLYPFEGNFPAERYERITTPRDISPCRRRAQIHATKRVDEHGRYSEGGSCSVISFAKRTSHSRLAIEREETREMKRRWWQRGWKCVCATRKTKRERQKEREREREKDKDSKKKRKRKKEQAVRTTLHYFLREGGNVCS